MKEPDAKTESSQGRGERPPVALYPFISNYFERNGHQMHYLDEGKGPVLLMVHGNPTWSFYYRQLVVALRDRYRCIVPDHIGCGLSDKPQPPKYGYTLRERVDDLTALLDHLQIGDDVTLIAHDWGGMIGTNWALHHRAKIKRLLYLNTAAFGLPSSKWFPVRLWLGRNTRIGSWLITSENLFCVHAADIGVKRRPLPPEVREWYLKPYDTPENRVAVLKFVQTIPLKPKHPGFDIVQETGEGLAQFKDVPTLICWGMKDFVFDKHFFHEWERRVPWAEIHRFDDCGHYILEDAATEVIGHIEAFLKKHA